MDAHISNTIYYTKIKNERSTIDFVIVCGGSVVESGMNFKAINVLAFVAAFLFAIRQSAVKRTNFSKGF